MVVVVVVWGDVIGGIPAQSKWENQQPHSMNEEKISAVRGPQPGLSTVRNSMRGG